MARSGCKCNVNTSHVQGKKAFCHTSVGLFSLASVMLGNWTLPSITAALKLPRHVKAESMWRNVTTTIYNQLNGTMTTSNQLYLTITTSKCNYIQLDYLQIYKR